MLPDLDSFRFDDAARASCDIEYLWRDTMVFGASQSVEQQRMKYFSWRRCASVSSATSSICATVTAAA
jgi:hypothetical protein